MKYVNKYISGLLIFGFFTLTGCQSGIMQAVGLLTLDDATMNQKGAEAFEKIKKETTIETNAGLNNYVKCVSNNILAVANDTTGVEQWEIVVFRDQNINAFALPGGKIGVFTGLLNVAKTQDQLAAVIGHEVAHVLERHGKERIQQQVVAGGGMAILEQFIGDNPLLMGAIGAGAQYGVLLPFSREHETEADISGLDLMAKAGFNPEAAVTLWKNMSAAGGSKPPEFMSTHPADATRINNLNARMPGAMAKYQAARSQGKNPKCK